MRSKPELSLAHQIGQRMEDLPDQVRHARSTVRRWNTRALRMTEKRPGMMLLGALAVGFVLAKLARYA